MKDLEETDFQEGIDLRETEKEAIVQAIDSAEKIDTALETGIAEITDLARKTKAVMME